MREENIPRELQSSEESHSKYASVRIMGNLGHRLNGERVNQDTVETPMKLSQILEILQNKYSLDLRRDSTLIMVNGVEARALDDLDTIVQSGDEIVLVPMFHGG